MIKIDNPKMLLYIEPKKEEKLFKPIIDDIVRKFKSIYSKAQEGTCYRQHFNMDSGYRVVHTTECGERSTNKDYLLENGMVTNSLALFYLKYYRNSIPQSEHDKLNILFRDIELINIFDKEVWEKLITKEAMLNIWQGTNPPNFWISDINDHTNHLYSSSGYEYLKLIRYFDFVGHDDETEMHKKFLLK